MMNGVKDGKRLACHICIIAEIHSHVKGKMKVHYFNNERLSYKLNYKTPVQYRIEQGFE